MTLGKTIASFFGIGLIKKGAGTVAAFIMCVLLYANTMCPVNINSLLPFFSILILIVGVWSSREAERSWGKDSNKIVIDEVLGMAISLLFLPINLTTLCIGFVLFRFFDIVKPLYIKRAERFPGGWGVMMDDVIAGVYTNIVIQILIITNLLK